MMRRLIGPKASITFLLSITLFFYTVSIGCAYPIIAEVDEDEEMCLELTIPDDDDAHLVFLAIPEDDDKLNDAKLEEVEEWLVEKIAEMTRVNSESFMKRFSLSADVEKQKRKVKNSSKSHVRVTTMGGKTTTFSNRLEFFDLNIVENIAGHTEDAERHWKPENGAFSICFENKNKDDATRIIYDHVVLSEIETKLKKHHTLKKEHLTPLEYVLDDSLASAKSILDEMYYMEKREIRMKQTADHTNSRIKYFSYFSVSILLGVTWIQVTYLKSYFKKKKVL